MCIRDSLSAGSVGAPCAKAGEEPRGRGIHNLTAHDLGTGAVSYTHLRAHETVLDLVCRLLLDNKNS